MAHAVSEAVGENPLIKVPLEEGLDIPGAALVVDGVATNYRLSHWVVTLSNVSTWAHNQITTRLLAKCFFEKFGAFFSASHLL
ncbi:hypothetical protein [Acidithiobacillus sulfuriphilus]|uniref:hypothetical protein n=1 Tax=Acidithiobacillus sulfuriphilus TaxID=1867749 RepID=UPI003F62137A